MNYKEIIHIWLSDTGNLNFSIGGWIFIFIGLIILICLYKFFKNYRVSDIELSFPLSLGKVKLTANHEVIQIAHKAWTEMVTRKAGLLFDPEHDVIIEVYDSWFELFKTTRLLIKEIPANQVTNSDTKLLVGTLIDVLNKGMRPHLTKWQARFRRWYDYQIIEGKKDVAPQDLQKLYPHYEELVQDLVRVNKEMVSYANELKKIFN